MKRTIAITAWLLATALGAQGRPVNAYYDLIRPNAHPRSDAIHQADLNYCYGRTGASRYHLDNAAMKKCMLGRGYRYMWGRNVPDAPSSAPDSFSYTYPDPSTSTPPYVPPPNPPPDPMTGMPIPGYSY
jgi:hypothetical protein